MRASKKPTAQTFERELASTAAKRSVRREPPGFGLLLTFQPEPFQCSISVCRARPFENEPTAQTFRSETAATPVSWSFREGPPGFGLVTCRHLVPSQCSTSVCHARPFENRPTAQASQLDLTDTPAKVFASSPTFTARAPEPSQGPEAVPPEPVPAKARRTIAATKIDRAQRRPDIAAFPDWRLIRSFGMTTMSRKRRPGRARARASDGRRPWRGWAGRACSGS